jgi:hypothetical protein
LCGRVGDLAIPDDPFVAQTQMRLFFSGTRLAVEDVGGGNGIFTRLRNDREVGAGGEVRVGRQRLVVEAVPPLSPAEDGSTAWGSPDAGYRFRVVQILEGGVNEAPSERSDNLLGRENGDIARPTASYPDAAVLTSLRSIILRDLGSQHLPPSSIQFSWSGDRFHRTPARPHRDELTAAPAPGPTESPKEELGLASAFHP